MYIPSKPCGHGGPNLTDNRGMIELVKYSNSAVLDRLLSRPRLDATSLRSCGINYSTELTSISDVDALW
jgi:hypothetical protein